MGREWFSIDKSTVLEAIRAVKKDYANLSNSKTSKYTPIIFRPEQKDAIERTVKQFKKQYQNALECKNEIQEKH